MLPTDPFELLFPPLHQKAPPMFDGQMSVFVLESSGPYGEIRYREVARCNPNAANEVARALKEVGRQVVVQKDHRPPHSY